MVRTKIKYIVEDTDRHGTVRLYYRRRGKPKVRLPGPLGSPEFWDAYRDALAGKLPAGSAAPDKIEAAASGSLRWLCQRYLASPEFKMLAPSTRDMRRRLLDAICREHGDKPFDRCEARHVRAMRDAKSDLPAAANGLVKMIRQIFAFAIEAGYAEKNPARDVPMIRFRSEGFTAWTPEDIAKFEARHPVGTTPRLAMALLLYTAQRRSDVVALGRQHLRDGHLTFVQVKNRKRNPVKLTIPVVPQLADIMAASPLGDLTFLVTAFGRPFTAAGFGMRFRAWCDAAGLTGLSAHGLRKAAASRLADLGSSTHEIAAVTGHTMLKQVEHYTKAADQERFADRTLGRVAEEQTVPKSAPPSASVRKSGTHSDANALKTKEG